MIINEKENEVDKSRKEDEFMVIDTFLVYVIKDHSHIYIHIFYLYLKTHIIESNVKINIYYYFLVVGPHPAVLMLLILHSKISSWWVQGTIWHAGVEHELVASHTLLYISLTPQRYIFSFFEKRILGPRNSME